MLLICVSCLEIERIRQHLLSVTGHCFSALEARADVDIPVAYQHIHFFFFQKTEMATMPLKHLTGTT